jgi:SOS response regulatory protein OraA/RecX
MPDETTQLVEVDVRYDVGSREDPPGKAGLAHLVEHLMFQQKPDGPTSPPLMQAINDITTFFNAYTIWDTTHYMMSARAEQLDALLKIEAMRLYYGCQSITNEEFERERLREKAWADEAAVEYALAKLKEFGYLDDERFAFGFASYRVKQKPVGRQRLARDLQTKKNPKETADAALELVYPETPEDELIARAIEKRIRLRGRPTTRQETKSLYDHLLRLGFSYDLIIRKVREASDAPEEE